jgi:hypothetical protein
MPAYRGIAAEGGRAVLLPAQARRLWLARRYAGSKQPCRAASSTVARTTDVIGSS